MTEEPVGVWRVHRHRVVRSTNDIAKSLPPWEAVTAETQDAGRGRYGRTFSSGEGGLWLSAVVPMPGGAAQWTGFALVVGHAVLEWLRGLPLPDARLRWPNDLMVRDRKIAGLLLEQSSPDRCTVGIGMNITNAPWDDDPELSATATRLADEIFPAPGLDETLAAVLDAIARAHERMSGAPLGGLLDLINTSWNGPRPVEIHLQSDETLRGCFSRINAAGDLLLEPDGGAPRVCPAHHVRLLRDI